jgi:hypothetical protein
VVSLEHGRWYGPTDGARFVSLAPVADPGLVATTIARTLGVRDSKSRPPAGTLEDYLRNKELLLVLDNWPTDEQRARLSLATAHAVHIIAQATEQVYRLAGSSAIYQKSPIERCLRDAQTAPADFMVGPWVYESAGRVRLGLPWTPPLS